MKSLFTHWKTSVAGLLVGVLTLMLWLGKITVDQWAGGIGTVGAIMGMLAKDWDKLNQ